MRLEQRTRAPKAPGDVQLLLDEPSQPYIAIALIEASDQGWELGLEALKAKLVEKAAGLGADALILGQRASQGATYFVPIGTMVYGVSDKKIAGKAIVFRDHAAPLQAPVTPPTSESPPFRPPVGLEPGMSFAEIQVIKGEPTRRWSFERTTRWDYDDVIVIFDDGRATRFLPPQK